MSLPLSLHLWRFWAPKPLSPLFELSVVSLPLSVWTHWAVASRADAWRVMSLPRHAATVLGVGCKMFSILLNEAFLQPTSDKRRLLFIAMAVVASALYQQAPKRAERKAQDEASNV
jgi:hypothetical protein